MSRSQRPLELLRAAGWLCLAALAELGRSYVGMPPVDEPEPVAGESPRERPAPRQPEILVPHDRWR